VEGLGLGGGVGAELVGQGLAEALVGGQGGVGLVGQERAPPEQVQGPLGGGQGQGGLAAEAGPGLAGQPFRLVQVDLDPGPGHEPPPLAVAGDGVRAEHGPQPAHQRGQVGVGVGGRPPAPQGLDQHLGRDDRAPPGQQQLQQGASLAASHPVGRDLAPSTATVSTPSTCIRRLPWRPIRRLWSIAAARDQGRRPPAVGLSPWRRRSPGCRPGRRPRPSAHPMAGRPARPACGHHARAGAQWRRRSRRRTPRG
jgi:hypothetical protein